MNRPALRRRRRRASDRRPAGRARTRFAMIAHAPRPRCSALGVEADAGAADRRVGARAEPERQLDHLLDARHREIRMAEQTRPRRLVADDDHVGLAAVQQARATRRSRPDGTASPGPRSRPSDRRQRPGVSISAAPAAKSATTASIGMPPPAIMMPVWPVARKSASMPRAAKARGDRQRGIFLAERAVGADRQQPLAAALAARSRSGCRGAARGRRSGAGRARSAASAQRRECPSSRACMPLTMSRPASSASTQRRNPRCRR